MSDRKLAKIAQKLFSQIWKLYRSLTKGLVTWLLRTAMLMRHPRAAAGFVLPTTVFLILVVALTAGALSFRAFNTSRATIGEVQNRIIYNAATPAIQRARIKLEYLFTKDTRYPGGVAAEGRLMSMMLNDGSVVKGTSVTAATNDPYTLKDNGGTANETRVDIDGDGQRDNAWVYRADSDGNGTNDASVIYSITFSTPLDVGTTPGWQRLLQQNDVQKATGEVDAGRKISFVRNGPLSNNSAVTCNTGATGGTGTTVEQGWYQDANVSSKLRKRFQIDALVVRDDAGSATRQNNFATLELQQDRQLERLNKWGAWFRNDLEIYPGLQFNWNGAMHSEGSIFFGNNFKAYLISSKASCLFNPAANSEITVREVTDTPNFKGIIASGLVRDDAYGANSAIDLYQPNGFTTLDLGTGNDWATDGAETPINISLDAKSVQYKGISEARGTDKTNNANRRTEAQVTADESYNRRFKIEKQDKTPNVDDTYRADDRLGPKRNYGITGTIRIPDNQVGNPIATATFGDPNQPDAEIRAQLTSNSGTVADPTAVGLDGYWERRAASSVEGGTRILVGERLQLGNPFGWDAPQNRPGGTQPAAATYTTVSTAYSRSTNFDTLRQANYTAIPAVTAAVQTGAQAADPDKSDNPGDPLNPPYKRLTHGARQRRSLRDNLAAVQGTAIYHFAAGTGSTNPVACLATTAHPGSPNTLRQSINFVPTSYADGLAGGANTTSLLTDFFFGRGTNGWEFDAPTLAELETAPWQAALNNLANFSGDPDGAYPPKQEALRVHPDPNQTMWGNFSNLRRALATPAASRSLADQSYLQTAACTLGMLAYNVDQVQKFNPSNANNDSGQVMTLLARDLFELMDGDLRNGEVLQRSQLATYAYNTASPVPNPAPAPTNPANYNARDYDGVPVEAFLGRLLQKLGNNSNNPEYRLAELIFAHYQVRRDRTYGFRPSPAVNTWNYNPYVAAVITDPAAAIPKPAKSQLWSSACNPNDFVFAPSAALDTTARDATNLVKLNSDYARYRLALSRLCGTVIPPEGVHDRYAADYNYPARNVATNNLYLPNQKPDSVDLPLSPAINTDATTYKAVYNAAFDTAFPARDYGRAFVAPQFPSLYYLFPEKVHAQAGTTEPIGAAPDAYIYDHRQPYETGPTGTTLPIALQPWEEPYVTAVARNVPTTPDYQPVEPTDVITGDPADDPLEYDAANDTPRRTYTATAPAAGFITSNDSNPATSFLYKPLKAYPIQDTRVDAIALRPRRLTGAFAGANPTGGMGLNNWVLPVITPANAAQNKSPNRILIPNNTVAAVPLLDRVIFDGREWLPIRVLDLDLGLMRRTGPTATETWLPKSGLIYAFREDAVREDAIMRPPDATPVTGNPHTDVTTADLLGTDPNKSLTNGFSIKSVDFVPDPDRRAHGFRLRNGARVDRIGIASNYGLSFFSDNPAYVMGDFNLHQKGGGDDGTGELIEEFREKLFDTTDDYDEDEFYNTRTTLDPDFAKPEAGKDHWRPSDVLADTVTFLSESFCDGSVIDTFMTTGANAEDLKITGATSSGGTANAAVLYQPIASVSAGTGAAVYNDQARGLYAPGCTNEATTSFLNQNRPEDGLPGVPPSATLPWNWSRENPYDLLEPVKISRNGGGMLIPPLRTTDQKFRVPTEYGSDTGYYFQISDGAANTFNEERPRQAAGANTRVNSIISSGIIPSRLKQSYGGLHNYPRFLESWAGRTFWFSGSFLQLNYSNYATAPLDQDTWEPGPNAGKDPEVLDFYFPPARRWGYDVALQFAPAGPVASRLVLPQDERNEFYTEPAANDPYIKNLCEGLKRNPPGGSTLADLRCPS